ncbi:DUF4411 family protein [Psychromarinibacter sp. C21-152]|uniref:DUF4411 family protein n=1 Tax=Psychromarinibacter sediminicola TaxID=3033385 RepID=A0AAE3NXC9_9RHOB|nr:DUF4411 family protein [Psychromarinibacter sediminicola]MDF0602685.1 DUF4411 family protein [Psychromarinibacter sediminicola]
MYVIDANVFIQAANSYYAFDIVPKFWSWLESELGSRLFTITPVKDEILAQKDQLSEWFASVDDPGWVLPADEQPVQLQMPVITKHCFDKGYRPAGISKFLSGADPWVIACAREKGWTVVTQEIAQPEARAFSDQSASYPQAAK